MVDSCPACGSGNLDWKYGFTDGVCNDCGFVLNGSATSIIECRIQDNNHSNNDEKTGDDLAWWNEVSITDASDQLLVDMIDEMDTYSRNLGFNTDEISRTAELLVEAWEQNFLHGRSKDATIGAVIVLASRDLQCPRPIGVVAKSIEIEERELRNHFSKLVDDLHIRIKTPGPGEFLSYLGDVLNASDTEIHLAREFLESKMLNSAANPVGIAAASLYITVNAERNITLKKTAEAAGLVKETVWKRKRELIE